VIDTLNFGFWGREGKSLFAVEYQQTQYTGYLSLCAAVNRAIDVIHVATTTCKQTQQRLVMPTLIYRWFVDIA
jgi:hypothetical protein